MPLPSTFRSAALVVLMLLTPASHAGREPLRQAATTRTLFSGPSADPYTLALRATIWGYPLVRAAELRQKATQPDHPFAPRPATLATAPINRLGRARALANPETRIGVAPNNDTLYALAFLDTDVGPFQLDTPDFGRRYYVFQFGEADSSTRYAFGQGSHGAKLPPIFIVGPGYRDPTPPGAIVVRSQQRYLMVAGRVLIDGPKDLPLVHALQDRIQLRKWLAPGRLVEASVTPQRPLATAAAAPWKLLADLGVVLADWRAAPEDRALLASFRRIGLTPRGGFRVETLAPADRAAVERGIADGLEIIRAKTKALGTIANGWSTSDAGSQFGQDYLLRAAVAMDQIYVLDKREALYPVAHLDGAGQPLDGHADYVICFPKRDLPPVDAFWSITLYYDRGFLVPNAIGRYSIGDRTPGIAFGRDGSLRLYIQNADPGPDKRNNWLPTPREKFMLMMRLYHPTERAIAGRWHPPAVIRVSPPSGASPAGTSGGECGSGGDAAAE